MNDNDKDLTIWELDVLLEAALREYYHDKRNIEHLDNAVRYQALIDDYWRKR